MSYYGTLDGALTYFNSRLHSTVWANSAPADRPKALTMATELMDNLNFCGYKTAVYTVLVANTSATASQIREADLSQELEFPRDGDTTIPVNIQKACYEIAYALLSGKNPDMELDALAITGASYGGAVSTTYNRNMTPIQHILHRIPSPAGWRLLQPFLRATNNVQLIRQS